MHITLHMISKAFSYATETRAHTRTCNQKHYFIIHTLGVKRGEKIDLHEQQYIRINRINRVFLLLTIEKQIKQKKTSDDNNKFWLVELLSAVAEHDNAHVYIEMETKVSGGRGWETIYSKPESKRDRAKQTCVSEVNENGKCNVTKVECLFLNNNEMYVEFLCRGHKIHL